jgi:hypothetical protein
MKIAHRFIISSTLALCLLALATCKPATPANSNNQGNRNQNAQANLNQPSNTNAPRVESKPPAPGPGTANIEIASNPPGADVILVPMNEDGASPPKSYGRTPTTVNVPVGTYMVNLEKSGYNYFQRKVEAKNGKTERVKATLKKK